MIKKNFLYFFIFCLSISVIAQNEGITGQSKTSNALRYTVAFLTIAPDSRASGMGDLGVATSADAFSLNWNIAKLSDIQGNAGLSLGYTPWLKKLVDDINLAYLTGYYRLDENQVFGAGLRYFSLGYLDFTDADGGILKAFRPYEFSLDAGYSRKLGPLFSIGLTARYIHSNLAGNFTSQQGGEDMRPGNALATDLGSYFHKKIRINDYRGKVSAGLIFSNIGMKMTYSENNKHFLPMAMKLGGGLSLDLDNYNALGFYTDLSKLLVPTPGNKWDSTFHGQNTSVVSAIFRSFYDAPGYKDGDKVVKGWQEEFQEIMISVGAEYLYSEVLAIRAGYYGEHERKGNRKYITMGVGFKLNVLGMDLSYLIPTRGNSPLAHTVRFNLILDLGAMGKN